MIKKTEEAYILRWSKHLKAIEMLGGQCQICGEQIFQVLEFHHVYGEKEHNINDLFIRGSRWSEIEKEIKKCILLCRNCHKIEHNLDIKDSVIDKIKLALMGIKGVDGCQKCGLISEILSIFEFHHINPSDKKFAVSLEYKKQKRLTESIIYEIEKCDLLCGNCHSILHFDIDKFNKYKKVIIEKMSSYKENKIINHEIIKKLFDDGSRQVEICKITGYSKSTVSTILSNMKSE
jgi:hypothetical protein